jgi:hypothetical protein
MPIAEPRLNGQLSIETPDCKYTLTKKGGAGPPLLSAAGVSMVPPVLVMIFMATPVSMFMTVTVFIAPGITALGPMITMRAMSISIKTGRAISIPTAIIQGSGIAGMAIRVTPD